MASNRIGRHIAIAATLSICIQSQVAIPSPSHGQGATAEVPTAPAGTPEPPITSPAMPSPSIPDVASIITPDISAILNQSVPSPTTMIIDFAQNSTLNFSGDFINPANVTLYAISTDPNVTTASISAANIYNAGIITTILPSGGLPGYTNLVGNLNLVLNAVNNIVNIGEISSAGNLSLTAGNAIANVTSIAGVSAIMSATNNVSLAANNIVNNGTINAVNNLNLASVMASNLAINAVGGVFQAGGSINIRDAAFSSKHNLDVLAGVWSSPALNFYSGTGVTKMALGSATGVVNGSTGELYLSSVATLNLGNVEILGDPSFSSDGDLFLGSVSANEAITAHANGNIFAGSLIADGGAITLQAGGAVSASGSLQSTHSIYIIGSTVSAAGTVMSAGDFIHIGGDVIDVSGASLTAGGSVDFYATTLVANEAQITAGDSISVVGSDVGSVSLNEAVVQSGNNFGAGSGQISAIDAAITATGQVYLGTSAGNISAANLQVTAQDSVTIDSLNGGVELSGSSIKSNGGNVFVYGNQSVNLGDVIDTSDPDGGGRIFVASANGSVNAPGEGFITTGPNPLVPPPGFFEISINAKESVSVGHLTSGGGNVSVQSGSLIERNGGAVLAFVTQEGTGSTSVAEINTAGVFTGRGDVEVFGAEGGVQVSTITGNGMSVLVDSRGSLSVESVINDITDGRGGYPTITLVANAADPLTIHEGIISASGVSGGGLVAITNYGMGGVSINADAIAIAATESGAGGALFVTSSSWININGDLTIDGKDMGSGGIVELSALGGDVVVSGKMSANGVGEGMSGGRIVLSSLTGNVTIGGGEVTVNGESGDGGGFAARTFGASGTVTVPSVSANGGGDGAGGSISISGANVAGSNLNLDANGSGSGSGGRVWIQLDDSFDAGDSVTISAHGGDSGNGGNLLLSSGRDLQVDSAKWNIAAGTNGNGGSVTLQSGLSGEMSQLSIAGAVNVDGNGVGNGGLIEIKVLGEGSDFIVGSGGNATVLSARSGSEGGNGGSIVVTASGDLTATASALRAYTRGDSGDGGYYELRAGASGGGPIGGIVAALEGGASGPLLTVAGTLNADGAKSGQGGKIIVSASGENASIDLHEAKLLARGGSVTGDGGSVSATASGSIDLGATNISVSGRGGGDGGGLEITGGIIQFDNDKISLTADGGDTGRGGNIQLVSTGTSNGGGGDDGGGIIGAFLFAAEAPSPPFIISARSKDLTSSGGTILISMAQDDVSIQDFSQFTINGNGAASNITLQAKSLSIGSSATPISILARGTNGDTPIIQLSSLEGGLSVYGNLNASGTNDAAGGIIGLNAIGGNLVFVGNANADGAGTGGGGSINFSAVGDNASVQIGEAGAAKNITARGGASGGSGGVIEIHADGDIVLNGSFLSAGARGGSSEGGSVIIEAGNGGAGMVRSLGNINTVGRGNARGGNITIDFKSEESLTMATNGKGELLAFSEAGIGGDITIHNHSANLDIKVNDTISVLSSAGGSGTITFLAAGDKIDLSGPGTLQGDVVANEVSDVSIKLSGKTTLDVKEISSETGNVQIELTANGSKISLVSANRALEATKGNVILKASEVINLDSGKEIKAASKLELSSAGALKVSSNGGKLTLIDSAPSPTRRIDIKASSINFEGTQLDIDTSRPSNPGGDVTIEATTGNISNSGVLRIKTDGGLGAGTISVTAQGSSSLKNVDFSAQTIGSAGKRGSVYVSALDNLTIYGTINASSSTTSSEPDSGEIEPGGTITLTGAQVLTPAEKNLKLIATGGESGGGKVEVISSKALNLSRTQIDVSVKAANGQGGIVIVDTTGTLTIGGQIDVSGRGTGAGGRIDLTVGKLSLSEHLHLKADGGNEGNGGTVSLKVNDGTVALGSGTAANAVSLTVLRGNNGGLSGDISIRGNKGLTYNDGISASQSGEQFRSAFLTAGSSGKLTINDDLKAVGLHAMMELKGGDISFGQGVSLISDGVSSADIAVIADSTGGTGQGSITLRNASLATSNGGLIEIASTAEVLVLNQQGALSAGNLGTIVVRNSVGELDLTITKTGLLTAGKVGLSAPGNIKLDVASGQRFFGDTWVGQISSAKSFASSPNLDGAASQVILGTGNNPVHTLNLQNVQVSNGLNVLANVLNLKGQIVATGDINLAARQLDLGNSLVKADTGSIKLLGFLDNGAESGKLTLFADHANLTASNQISIHANSLLFTGTHSVVTMNGSSVDVTGVNAPATVVLNDSIFNSAKVNSTFAVKASHVQLNEGSQLVSSGLMSLSLNSGGSVTASGVRGFIYGNSVAIQSNSGEMKINNVDASANTTLALTTSVPDGTFGHLFLENTRITANQKIVLVNGSLPDIQEPGVPVPGLTTSGNVLLNNSVEPNRLFVSFGTSSISASEGSQVEVFANAANQQVRFGNASIEAGVSEFRGISFSQLVQPGQKRSLHSRDFILVTDGRTSVTMSENKTLRVPQGNLIISSKNDLTIETGKCTLHLLRGTTIYVSVDKGELIVDTLCDSKKGAVVVSESNQSVEVPVGYEFATSVSKFAKRNSQRHAFGSMSGQLSEFSIPHLIKSVELVNDLKHLDLRAFSNILKAAACIYIVTSRRGPYSRE